MLQDTPSQQGSLLPSGRELILFASAITTALGAWVFLELLRADGFQLTDGLVLALFTLLLFWIAFSFWIGLGGVATLLLGRGTHGLQPADSSRALTSRTAILVPVYNEDPNPVFANLAAMYEGLAASPQGRQFDFFVLSDTTEPRIWVAEEAAWYMVRRLLKGGGRIHYRKRLSNRGRKAGNIEDFCRRWGAHYDYMVVLDADSLMSPATLLQMVRRMDANPKAGLMQVPPVLINRQSLFARIQQFSSAVATPILAHGLAVLGRSEGNFWGHNAIIRVRAFMESCGLPELNGRKPFGGTVMSHDFVEAALLRRVGWQVWMLPDLGGSYEEPPPSIVDHALRDRRWSQGNLQHLKVLPAKGLHWVSRLHLLQGIFSYLASPLWLGFLILGLTLGMQESLGVTQPLEFAGLQAAPGEVAGLLLGAIMLILFTPRLLGLLCALAPGRSAALYGGRLKGALSLLLEMLFSALLAPAMMIFHSRFVLEVLLGRDSGWNPQQRNESSGLRLSEAVTAHRLQLGFGLLACLALVFLPQGLAYWFSPIVGGLLLSPFLAWATSRPALGQLAWRLGLFLSPAESQPEPVILRARELSAHPLVSPPDSALQALAHDQKLFFLHRAILNATTREAPQKELLEQALEKHRKGVLLDAKEESALLSDTELLEEIVAVQSRLENLTVRQLKQVA